MFTLPPLPPIDYEIRDVTWNLCSNQEFTPDAEPRVTLPTIAKFCYPIESDELKPGEYRLLRAPPKILDRWAVEARAEWVPEPQTGGYLTHDMYKKYNVIVDPDYDPRFKFSAGIASRSFKYELDCIEVKRREKLAAKVERELAELRHIQNVRDIKKIRARPPSIKLKTCELEPPFWWSQDGVHETKVEAEKPPQAPHFEVDSEEEPTYLRWQKKPRLFSKGQRDPCDRQLDLLLVGQPFKNEAINWYYTNYPPPNIPFHPKRFN